MERAQIVSGANGVFRDGKGRVLQTMGDICPNVGDWVWTNGTTIYGHRESGQQPEVISNTVKSVLPFVVLSYSSGGYEVTHLNKEGALEKFVEFSYKDNPLRAYVGDDRHAYGGVYGKSSEYEKLDWYNLLTGEFLGTFAPIDACIAYNGDLLTIECEKGSFYNAGTIPGIDNYHLSACPIYESVDNPGGPVTKLISITGMYYEKKTDQITGPSSQHGIVVIRRNGKIIKTIDLDEYMNPLGEIVLLQAMRIHGINGGAGEGRDFMINMDPGNILTTKRKRPMPQLVSKSASVYALKIYPDGSYLGYIDVYASASAFPVVESEINQSFMSRSDKETVRIKTKDFFRASASAYRIFGLGKVDGEYYFTNTISGSGAFYGGEVARLGSRTPVTITLFDLLPGYKLKAARYKGPFLTIDDDNVGNYETWTVISDSDIDYSGLGRKADRDQVVNALKDSKIVSSQTDKLLEIPVETVYDIHNGFKIRLQFENPAQPESAKALTLIGPEHEKIFTFTRENGGSMLIYYWYKMIACKLDKDLYFVTLNQTYSPSIVIEKGVLKTVATAMQNYSLSPFKNRTLLRNAIWKQCRAKDR